MALDPEQQTRENLGWFYMKALRHVAKRGRWPDSLTGYERRRLRDAGIVELVYCSGVGWQPRLTEADKRIKDDDC